MLILSLTDETPFGERIMSKIRIKFIYRLVITAIFLIGCSKISDRPEKSDFFNLAPPGDTAVVFAQGIVSSINHEHSRITFSNDGTKLLWAVIPVDSNYRKTGGNQFKPDEQNIWISELISGKWIAPAIFEFTKESGGSGPVFSGNGKEFFYRSPKPNVNPHIKPKPSQIWKVDYSEKGWGKPVKVNNLIPVNENKTYMSFCFAENGNLYFDYGGPNSVGEWSWDIYFSKYNGGDYCVPVKLESGINDGDINWCPWIAPDESYIIYSSHRDGEKGQGDLYINFRDHNGIWSQPIHMEPAVNSEMQERFPSVSPDGKYLFFARNVPDTFSDIYWVDAKIIEELKPKELK